MPDPYITRDEFAKYTSGFVERLERVEKLCFEDEKDADGNITRPSLENIMLKLDRHINVMCDYANMTKNVAKLCTALGTLYGLAKLLGYV